MHPAFSVIFFTVVSGCGFGLMIALGLLLASGAGLLGRGEALFALTLAGTLAGAGLLSSMLHLGQPQRAWRALSQWRTSWLSREGVVSIVTFAPLLAGLYLLWRGTNPDALRVCGLLLAVSSALTLYCTAGIYNSLKTIRAWHNAYVLPGYLLLGLLGGSAWLWLIDAAASNGGRSLQIELAFATLLLALASAALKRGYWRFVDAPDPASSVESATGLGRFGNVRAVEAPHTEENYLTQEMGFQLARKHARKLRGIAALLLGLVPALSALIALVLLHRHEALGALRIACAGVALLSVIAGTFVERWLFFAEAKHVVMLYYGTQRA